MAYLLQVIYTAAMAQGAAEHGGMNQMHSAITQSKPKQEHQDLQAEACP